MRLPAVLVLLAASSCGPPKTNVDIFALANACFVMQDQGVYLVRDGEGFAFSGTSAAEATPLWLRPSDLATTLLYDPEGGYVVRDGDGLVRKTTLESDISRIEDGYISGAEWLVEAHPRDKDVVLLRSKQDPELVLGRDGMIDKRRQAARVVFEPAEGCAEPPELTVDATGTPGRTTFEDGDLYGIVDAHSHIFTNFGFAGSLFHGSPFHPLGVEHALPDCSIHHGEMGRKDFFGFAFDNGDNGDALTSVLFDLIRGELGDDNHETAGYPEFTEWPDSRKRSTHQVQYYKWLERAWLSGLRLVVQHATTNEVICDVSVGAELVPGRYDCTDMTGVDRQIDGAYALERYVDAMSGGPGKGWFRIVKTPAEAREVIADGKMAVILGIETSNLFDCLVSPNADRPACTLEGVQDKLDAYQERGIRALFPVHKYDNAFTPGDGHDGFIEIGNVINSGHYTNMTQDCPDIPTAFDDGPVSFGGFLKPRDEFQSAPPLDFSGIKDNPVKTLLPYVDEISEPPIEGDWCQNASMTDLGVSLIEEMMKRGIIIELDHLPRKSYAQVFQMLRDADYPAVGTHNNDNDGKLYEIGGISFREPGRCHDPVEPGLSWRNYNSRLQLMVDAGLHPSLGFAFDLNGFAGGPRPRFGEDANCEAEQENPITYPFMSYDGAVTFTEPKAGERTFDFNTEGMATIGLLPELIEDFRRDAVSEDDLDPLFRSAEGYIRMWERTEARAAAYRGE
ncbi:MAG: hypothetical protein AB8H79_07940 [Myxococcota bacterium]